MKTKRTPGYLLRIFSFIIVLSLGGWTMPSAIEQIEAYAVATRIDVRAEIGDTKLTLRAPLHVVPGEESMQFRINPGEATEEDATVSSTAGRVATLSSGLTYAHNAGELVIRLIYHSMLAEDSVDASNIVNRTRKFLVQAYPEDHDTQLRTLYGFPLHDAVTKWVCGNFYVPEDYVSNMAAVAVVIPMATGNVVCNNSYAAYAKDEDYETHQEASGISTVTLSSSEIAKEIQPFNMTLVNKGDYVSMCWVRFGDNGNDTLSGDVVFVGWLISYTADS